MKFFIYLTVSIFSSFAALPPNGGDIGSISRQERFFPPACSCADCSMSSTFGPRTPPIAGASANHSGCDLRAPSGTELTAVAPGEVKKVEKNESSGYGNQIEIEYTRSNGEKFTMKYAHLSKIDVTEGTRVTRGMKIGTSGNSGTSTGPHLHVEVHINGTKVDPAPYFDPAQMKQQCDSLRRNQDAPAGGGTSTAA